ncbi:MAG: hypothetical protein MIO92_00145 [Methanosarcinaceae archaeon]|nr:hypothetical protein [Methanosarcinaceae archaeon]
MTEEAKSERFDWQKLSENLRKSLKGIFAFLQGAFKIYSILIYRFFKKSLKNS